MSLIVARLFVMRLAMMIFVIRGVMVVYPGVVRCIMRRGVMLSVFVPMMMLTAHLQRA